MRTSTSDGVDIQIARSDPDTSSDGGRRSRSRRGWIAAVATVAVVAVAGVVGWVWSGQRSDVVVLSEWESGPAFEKLYAALFGRLDVGSVKTIAVLNLINDSDAPVTIEEITPIWGEPGLAHLGTLIIGQEREIAGYFSFESFPPDDPTIGPLYEPEGYVIEPEPEVVTRPRGAIVAIGVEMLEGPRATLWGIEVTYLHRGTRYRERFNATAAFCTAGEAQDCAEERGADTGGPGGMTFLPATSGEVP